MEASVVPRRVRAARRGFGAACVAWFALTLCGHDMFRSCVQQQAQFRVGTNTVDIALELTFFEDWSERERRVMDANHDGRVQRQESMAYARRWGSNVLEHVQLRWAGSPVDLVLLHDPEVELLESDGVGPGHHRLRFELGARPPQSPAPGDELLLRSRLWLEVPALVSATAQGRDGVRVRALAASQAVQAPREEEGAWDFRVRYEGRKSLPP